MKHLKSIQGFSAVAAIVMILASATTLAIGTTTLNAQAQNGATPQQIKDFLTQAIQALDSGDNTKAGQQLKLAAEQMGALTGVSVASTTGESGDKGEGIEEGPGEDADESGDSDKNDEED
ncbi:hypothetical protein BH18THE2_BH18THE2_06880 [soil metagenome]